MAPARKYADGSARYRFRFVLDEETGEERLVVTPRDRSKYSPRRNTPKAARR